ncbi:MAG: hypothetical protein ACK5W9_02995 [Bdellovibrionales bacterium]
MKQLIALTALFFSILAQAETRSETVTKATGRESIISLGACSSPVLGLSSGIYQSSFTKVSCKEYETYQADVQGSGWTRKESRTSQSTLSYRIDQETITKTNIQYSNPNTGDAGADAVISLAEAAILMMDASNQCNNTRMALQSVLVNVNQTQCAQ